MPIGPLGIALRRANASRRPVAILAIVALALLALGVGMRAPVTVTPCCAVTGR